MTKRASIAAVIVAAGRGRRVGGTVPKQWRELGGRTVAARAVEAFASSPLVGRVVLVLHPDDMDRAAGFPDAEAVPGGETRSESVLAGLEALAVAGPDLVLIHDAARPLVSQRVIADVVAALAERRGAAPALPVTDALWEGRGGVVDGVRGREGLFRAQTPQGFDFPAILAAHRAHSGEAADDVAIARAAGIDVAIVPGEEANMKLTEAGDFGRAAALLGAVADIRTGTGFDVHRFGEGDSVTLCGVAIPHERGLAGHSDADVGMHAATDAIYGALAEGDIGRHFPPSDARWKGADSAVFLRHAAGLARERGFRIGNLDVTIACERPKIGPHAGEMARAMSEAAGIDASRISVKATTTERLGFAGRGEGIAAMASATLLSP